MPSAHSEGRACKSSTLTLAATSLGLYERDVSTNSSASSVVVAPGSSRSKCFLNLSTAIQQSVSGAEPLLVTSTKVSTTTSRGALYFIQTRIFTGRLATRGGPEPPHDQAPRTTGISHKQRRILPPSQHSNRLACRADAACVPLCAHKQTGRPWLPKNRPVNIGRDDWIRTSDPLTPSQVRYQAALHPVFISVRRSLGEGGYIETSPTEVGLYLRFLTGALLFDFAAGAASTCS